MLLNVILAIFNLVPLAPLDGFRVVAGLLPPTLATPFARLEPWCPGILMLLIVLPFLGGPAWLFEAMGPPRDFLLQLFAGDTAGAAGLTRVRDAATDLARHARRFFRGLRGSLTPAEERTVRSLLRPAELQLFAGLQGRERRHALDVLAWLRANASPSDELLVAALLHNTGKGRLYAHERILHVLLLQFAPGLHERLAEPRGRAAGARPRRAARPPRARSGAACGDRLLAAGLRVGPPPPRPHARRRPRAGLAHGGRPGRLTPTRAGEIGPPVLPSRPANPAMRRAPRARTARCICHTSRSSAQA